MTRLPHLVLATAVSIAVCLGFAPSGATAEDRVTLMVYARGIDSAVVFSTADGWSWRCSVTSNKICSVQPVRGQTVTITAQNGSRSSFVRWENGCAAWGTRPACTLQVNTDQVVTARFSPLRLSVPVFGQGDVFVEASSRRSCGRDCYEIALGDTVVLRPRERSGHRFTGWGSKCETVRRDCRFTMLGNGTAAATFEPIPPPVPCPPNSSCDPVTPSVTFVVSVSGRGKVVAAGTAPYRAQLCMANGTASAVCSIKRTAKKTVALRAIADPDSRFLGWGARCGYARLGTDCSFHNDYGADGAPRITAAFA